MVVWFILKMKIYFLKFDFLTENDFETFFLAFCAIFHLYNFQSDLSGAFFLFGAVIAAEIKKIFSKQQRNITQEGCL